MKDVPNCLAQKIMGNGMSIEELQAMVPLLDKFINVFSNIEKDQPR
jgi:hypothetical protein